MNLLVVDFSVFLPADLPAWGRGEEDPFFYEHIWPTRASALLARDGALPHPSAEALAAFWPRFRFARHARLLYADQGMWAFHESVREGVTCVWLFSPVHAAGYTHDAIERMLITKQVDRSNFMLAYAATDVELHMRYPVGVDPTAEPEPPVPLERLVDDGLPVGVVFDRVFLFKSPSFTPAWCDGDWHRFLTAAPFRRKVALDGAKRVRDFSLAEAQALATFEREAIATLREQPAREAGTPSA